MVINSSRYYYLRARIVSSKYSCVITYEILNSEYVGNYETLETKEIEFKDVSPENIIWVIHNDFKRINKILHR